jgi:hypothetical protein
MLLEEMKHGRGDADYSSVAQKYFPVSKTIALLPNEPVSATKLPNGGKKTPTAETPEGVNLSGGFRSWFSRRVPARETREDAGAA